jgi:hypothetical protein
MIVVITNPTGGLLGRSQLTSTGWRLNARRSFRSDAADLSGGREPD